MAKVKTKRRLLFMTSNNSDMDARRKQAFTELMAIFGSLTKMAAAFGISVPAISKWKRGGVPSIRVPYLMLKYPKLEAWKGLPRGV